MERRFKIIFFNTKSPRGCLTIEGVYILIIAIFEFVYARPSGSRGERDEK